MSLSRTTKNHQAFNPKDIQRIFGEEYHFVFQPERLTPVKRIAIFAESFFPRFDGVSQTVYITLRYLQETGREVLIFANDIAPLQVGPSQVIRLPSIPLPQVPDFRVGLPVKTVNRYLAEFEPDLIHLFSPSILSLRAISFGRKHQIPLVANYQTDVPRYLPYYRLGYLQRPAWAFFRSIHNHCDLNLVPSLFTLQELQDKSYKNLQYWRHGVNDQRFHPKHRSSAWRQKLLHGRDPHSVVCIFVGRLATEKNIPALLEVAKLPGVAMTIIGDGPQRRSLEKTFAKTNTYFAGPLFGEDLASAYASADVFVFPSITETFGLVVLEAMASGLPTVVRNFGGVTDLVQEGVTGLVCDTNDALVRGVIQLRDDQKLRQKISNQARIDAEQRTWNAVMAELEMYYQQALTLKKDVVS